MSDIFQYIGSLEPKQKTVLFIPGNMCSPVVFSRIETPNNVQTATIDWANSKGPWDIVSLGKRINQFITDHDLGETYLAGYSAGGAIALASAIDKRAQAAGLLISNTGANTIGHGDPDFPRKIKEQWGSASFIESFLNRCFSRPINASLKRACVSYIHTLNKEAVYEAASSLRQLDLKPHLSKIRCRTAIVHGVDDTSRTTSHAKELQENIPNAKLVFLKGGHTIMVENRKAWQNELWDLIG